MRRLLLALLLLAAPLPAQTNHAHMLAGVNAQTGVAYTFVAKDVTLLVTFNNAGAVTATMPDATTAGFGAGSIFTVKNLGTGNVTISAATSTFDGQASLLLITGQGVDIYSDGQNFNTGAGGSSGGGGGGSVVSPNTLAKGTGIGLPLVDSTCSDDSVNPVRCIHGINTASSGIVYEVANNTSTGTTLNRLACNDGTGKAITCPNGAKSAIIGITQASAGTSGNALICKLILCSVGFDNQSVVNDYAIAGNTGLLHDTGSATPTTGNTNFLVLSANAGTNTNGNVVPPGDLSGSSSSTGGFVNPMTTLGDTIYGGVAGAPTRLPGATTLNGVFQQYGSVAAGGVATAPVLAPSGVVPRFVAGTTDTILFTDRSGFIEYNNAAEIDVTLPQAGTTGFANNFYFCSENRGSGEIVFTGTVSTIEGNPTYGLAPGSSVCFVSDDANYFAKDQAGAATPPGGISGQVQWNDGGLFDGTAFVYSTGAGFPTLGSDPVGSGADNIAFFANNVAATSQIIVGELSGVAGVTATNSTLSRSTSFTGTGMTITNTATAAEDIFGFGGISQNQVSNGTQVNLVLRATDTSPSGNYWFIRDHANSTTIASQDVAGNLVETTSVSTPMLVSNGTTFTVSGCSTSSLVGGATAGQFVSGTTGTCAVTITLGGATAPTQWACFENDITTPADKQDQQNGTTHTAAFTGTTVSGDVMRFACTAF